MTKPPNAVITSLFAAMVANWAFASSAIAAPCTSLAGTWLGMSHCGDLAAAPSCKEERVRYRIAAAGTGLAMQAERAAATGFVPMGDGHLICDGGQGLWVWDIVTPNFRGRWSFGRAGDALTGELRLDNGSVTRRVEAHLTQ